MATQVLPRPITPATNRTNVGITPSKADNWKQCARRFSWQERSNTQTRGNRDYSFPLALGNAIHSMFAGVNSTIIGGISLPNADQALNQHWNDSHFQSDEEADYGRRKAFPMLQHYFHHLTDNHLTVNAYECFVTSPRKRVNEQITVTLSGKIDVVLESQDGTIFVEDYKTGLLSTKSNFASLMSTTIYHLLGRQLFPDAPQIVVGQIQPATGMRVSVKLTEEQVNLSKAQMKTMAMAIASDPTMTGDDFNAVAGEYCSWCPARDIDCPLFSGIAVVEEAF